MDNKKTGSYYTPIKTVKFIYNYLLQYKNNVSTVLEPSAGDGRFITLINELGSVEKVVGVELFEEKVRILRNKITSPKVKIIADDFLEYAKRCDDRFDLIVGNPPYISIKNMDKGFLENARYLCHEINLPENLIQNAWVAFVIASTLMLSNNGAIFFVLPIEFLQVKYAERLRGFLESKFNTIHIISFKERMFPLIEQEACLVYLTNESCGLPYIAYRQYDKLDSNNPFFESKIERNKPLNKWSNAVLSDEEIDILNRISRMYVSVENLANCSPGIVTGSNNNFILTKNEVIQYECTEYVKPIISKGAMVRNLFEINNTSIDRLALSGKKVFLLDLAEKKYDDFPEPLQKYLSKVALTKRSGIEIKNSYKCSKRKPWYGVPIVKSGQVVFFKRYDLFPRITTNPEDIYTTDIAYNLRLHDGIKAENLVFCFYNSLTLAQCEFFGRYYAGGVSELTPNEFRMISIPYREINQNDIEQLRDMFEHNASIDKIVNYVNSKTIGKDLCIDEISCLNLIRKKLIERRR